MRRRSRSPLLASWHDLRLGLWRPSVREEVAEELESHLELRTREYIARGMDPAAARAAALRRFGDLDRIRRDCQSIGETRERAMRRTEWLDQLRQDVAYALRQLRRSPSFTLVMVLTLTLGIGVTTAVFGVINGVLLKPMPYRDPERLLLIWDDLSMISVPEAWVTGPEIARLREAARLFDGFAAVRNGSLGLTDPGGGEPAQLRLSNVSANFFDLLGVRPMLGRGFHPGEDRPGTGMVMVVSHGLWRRRFGADPRVVGRTVYLDGTATTIVGVLSPDFQFVMQSSLGSPTTPDAYVPLQTNLATEEVQGHRYGVLARVRPGTSVAHATAELTAISRTVDQDIYRRKGFRFVPIPLRERLVREVRPGLLVLFGAVTVLVLIMCANLATLALTRAARREREFAVRQAIGAGRSRLTRQLLTETMVVVLAGALLGVTVAWWSIRGLLALAPAGLPRRDEVGIDLRVVLFTLGVAFVVGLAVGLAPVWYAARREIVTVMREKSPTLGANRTRGLLVLSQVALSLVLLAATGLLLTSFVRLLHVDPGFDARGVLTVDLRLSDARYPTPPTVAAFMVHYLEQLHAVPGVQAVGATSAAPLSGSADQYGITFPGSPTNTGDRQHDYVLVDYTVVTPGYLAAMGIGLTPGSRDFTSRDSRLSPPVAIIDERLARQYFPNGSALGQQVTVFGDTDAVTIVGIAKTVRFWSIQDDQGRGQIYRPHAQATYRGMTIALRAAGDPAPLPEVVRRVLREIDPRQPLMEVRPMSEIVTQSLGEQHMVMVLVTAFAAAALALATLGIYGVTSAGVAQRTRELGIRMALGAHAWQMVWLVLQRTMRFVVAGLALGLAASVGLSRLLQRFLYGVSATNGAVLAAVIVILGLVALVAGYLPARTATRVDPTTALRAE